MQDTGCKIQDAGCIPRVRVFQRPGSVFGARCSVLGVDSVPGPGSQVPDTWYLLNLNKAVSNELRFEKVLGFSMEGG
jgi:hypothetical protein